MSIRLDRTDKDPLARLPEGLKSIGMGLGAGGAPLHDVESMLLLDLNFKEILFKKKPRE